ncbi:MAG: FAD-binding oxidoreductase [Nakamurella sp.]
MTDSSWDSFRYRVRAAKLVTPVIRELWLEPVGEPMRFRAGQYMLLADAKYAIPQRSYSVASAPRADGLLSVLVTLVPNGPTSTWAHRLAMYDEVSVEGPFGTFVAAPDWAAPVLLLGAGSGLAPLRSLAEALLGVGGGGAGGVGDARPGGGVGRPGDGVGDARPGGGEPNPAMPPPVTLFFSGRTAADAIDRAQFEAWAAEFAQFDYRLTCTREAYEARHSRIPDLLAAEFTSLRGYAVFTSGPPGFVTGCQAAAEALGADPVNIRTEEFFTEPSPWSSEMPPIPTASIDTDAKSASPKEF